VVQRMIWLGEPLTAQQLHGWGLVTAVADSGQALRDALALAARLAEMAPNAIAGAKELLQQAPGSTLPQQLAAERDQFVANLFHANGGEGLKAFIEKRAPRFE